MDLYNDMSFKDRVATKWIFSLDEKAKNYVFMMIKIALDFYEDYPIIDSRWMDFTVINPFKNILGKKLTVIIDKNEDIKVVKIL